MGELQSPLELKVYIFSIIVEGGGGACELSGEEASELPTKKPLTEFRGLGLTGLKYPEALNPIKM